MDNGRLTSGSVLRSGAVEASPLRAILAASRKEHNMRSNEKGPELGQLRTLILGDDRGRVEAMAQLLARAGLPIRRASSADEALRA